MAGASALESAAAAAWAGWNPLGKSKQYIISPVKGRLSDSRPILRWRVAASGCRWQEVASGRAAIAIAAVRGRTCEPPASSYSLFTQRRARRATPYLEITTKTMNQERRTRLALHLPANHPVSLCCPLCVLPALGRAVIAIAAVRGRTFVPPVSPYSLKAQRRARRATPYRETAAISNEPRTKNTPSAASPVPPRGLGRDCFAAVHHASSSPSVSPLHGISPALVSSGPRVLVSAPCPRVTLPTCPLANFHPCENWRCPSILFSTSACCSGVSPSGNFFDDRRQRSSHSWPTSG